MTEPSNTVDTTAPTVTPETVSTSLTGAATAVSSKAGPEENPSAPTTTTAAAAVDKENNGSAVPSPKDSTPTKKRPVPETVDDVDESVKRTKTNEETSAAKAATSSSSTNDDAAAAPLDLAVTLGLKPGDRVEVQWEIESDGETVVKWWGASLLEFDGRTTDGVAIRTLHYDTCPELGFDETSDEDVIFLGDDLLVSPDSTTQLHYRREGEEDVFWLNEEDMDEQLNAILMGALAKNQATWKNLQPAQQAMIAEKIKHKKDQLLQVLRSKKEVITSASIKDILRETFGGSASA